jgi:hypothetical protein
MSKEGPRGIEVVRLYHEYSGRRLPHEFWCFYSAWCAAWSAQDKAQMDALRHHRKASLYSAWIDEVKRTLASRNSKLS